ncbi:MAG: RNA-binding protein [Proteobacteria bacterium]|nr:RNA-binding protein [Pseudomonadota bacterium]
MKLFVGNLLYEITEPDLQEMFAPFGAVASAKLITDRYTGQSRGFGFVEMDDREAGEAAVAAMNGKDVRGRRLTVNEARPRAPREREYGAERY